jgi:hypothetical protein
MKKLTLLFWVLVAWIAMPDLSYAQTTNYNVNLPAPFEYMQSTPGVLDLKWRLPRDIGDDYDGQTAKEMVLWSIQDYSCITLGGFQVAYANENYIYGYVRLIFSGDYPFTVTVNGLTSFSGEPNTPTTRVLVYNP